jgi:hypothetical protein
MDPLSIGLALSIHAGFNDDNFNKYHPFVEYETQSQYAVGVTYNSENNISFYAKKEWNFTDNSFVELGWATGYDGIEDEFDIPATPFVRLGYNFTDSVSVWAMPGGQLQPDGSFDRGIVIGTQKRF